MQHTESLIMSDGWFPEPTLLQKMNDRYNKLQLLSKISIARDKEAIIAKEDYISVLNGNCYYCLGEKEVDIGDVFSSKRECNRCHGTGRFPEETLGSEPNKSDSGVS